MCAERRRPRVLCVDDDGNLLDGLRRQLRREYEVHTALDARTAIRTFVHDGPFSVVISDQCMPVVDGVSLLAKIADRAPDTIRILLTGHADLDAAVAAVNRGRVFRFLTKPCARDELLATLRAGMEQYESARAERKLMDETLRGSVRALTEVMGLASPLAFSRAQRAHNTVRTMCDALGMEETWAIEVATRLSQLGCITLMQETLERLHHGGELSFEEQQAVERVPFMTRRLLRRIPRLEPALEILELHRRDYTDRGDDGPCGTDIPIGARMLRIALDFDDLRQRGATGPRAVAILRSRGGCYDPELLEAFVTSGNFDGEARELRECRLRELREGMVLARDVLAPGGALLVARGLEIGPGLLLRLRTFAENVGLEEPLLVAVPLPNESPESVNTEEAGWPRPESLVS